MQSDAQRAARSAQASDREPYSRLCTGGAAPCRAEDGAGPDGAEVATVPDCSGPDAATGTFWVTRRGDSPAWDFARDCFLEPDLPNPQECAMDGPAVYPTTAPATAPTGPSTTAPDKAPKAASPPRPWARAIAGANVKNIADARKSLFMYGSRCGF
jgi:hypothetical protein